MGNGKKQRGRPSIYTEELAAEICARLSRGRSLRTVCKDEDMPAMSTIFDWLREKPDFVEQYARAKEQSTIAMAEEIVDIADDASNDWMEVKFGKDYKQVFNREHAERSKLRIDSRKWLLSKIVPKKYGDKLDMTTNGKDLPTPIYGGKSTGPDV